MNITELGIIIEKTLNINKYEEFPDYYVDFHGVEISESNDNIYKSVTGRGKTIKSATNDYARKLRNQTIVIDAFRRSRREFKIPKTLKGF